MKAGQTVASPGVKKKACSRVTFSGALEEHDLASLASQPPRRC